MIFAGIHVSNHFHSVYGRDMIKVIGLSSAIQHDYTYDTFGRLDTVASGVYSADYDYQPNSDMLQSTTSKNNGATVLTTTRTWDYGMRLRSIANVVNNVTVSSHSYLYDAVQRRSQATLEDSSIWKYDYNDRNELTAGKRYWSDWTPVSGQQFEYGFDTIGNRTSTKAGGNENGTALRSSSYSANGLNQITNRTVPSAIDVLGVAKATASVTVNSSAAYEKGEYFSKEVSVSNGSGPAYQSITVSASEGGSNTNQTGNILVPPATQNFAYDADGNLTNDSVWSYTWDAENRLTQMTNFYTVVSTARKKLIFTYDFLGRRITKKVYPWSGSSYSATPETDLEFLYDGWNLIAELNATNNAAIRSYMWGQDLSESIDGAGGVGGLLMLTVHSAASTNHFLAYDVNGNAISLIDAINNSLSARYEYSPFGELLRATCPLARINAFRWSTKYTDEEAGLVYYGHRYYSPTLGRWISRDPIEEGDGANLYAFLVNGPLTAYDILGTSSGTLEDQEAADTIGLDLAVLGGSAIALMTLRNVRDSVLTWNAGQILVSATATTDANDDWEEELAALGAIFAGQLANNLPDPDDDGDGGIRRSSKGGNNQAQNKMVSDAANEAGLGKAGKEQLKRLLEGISRGGDRSPDYQTILRMAQELAQSAKYRR